MKHPVYIFGETDYQSERHAIDLQITTLYQEGKIAYLLSEELGNTVALSLDSAKQGIEDKKYTQSDLTYKLAINLGLPAIGIDNTDKKTYMKDYRDESGKIIDCIRSSSIRETRMVDVISKYAALGGCAVIINDAHLRTSPSEVYGNVSPLIHRFLCNSNVFIKSKAVNDSIVDVNGTCFNKNVYTRLLKLSNELTSEVSDNQKKKSHFFDMGDFLGDNVHTYCYYRNNTIKSMLAFTVNQNDIINIELFYTSPSHRNKGYGTQLFNRLFAMYPKNHYTFYVGPILNGGNAVRLYKKLGFNEIYTTLKL